METQNQCQQRLHIQQADILFIFYYKLPVVLQTSVISGIYKNNKEFQSNEVLHWK